MLAQEAARIIVDQGIRDYRVAKTKAADRLGMGKRGSLPGNSEIEQAVNEHLLLFGGDSHADHLRAMRETAISAMQMLEEFTPRLVGPVLSGIADENSAINLHVFADSPEAVAMFWPIVISRAGCMSDDSSAAVAETSVPILTRDSSSNTVVNQSKRPYSQSTASVRHRSHPSTASQSDVRTSKP